jgi:ATP-binding cassette subfamily B protein
MAFLDKIPRLVDRYFQSRLTSDMAERSHMVHWIRLLPFLGGSLLRYSLELVLTTAGIIWLDPASAPLALATGLLCAGLPLLLNPLLTERELRVRTHVGALGRFYLDAMLGLVAVRAHAAERAVRTEHESLLVEWTRAGFGLQRAVVRVEGLHAFAGFGLAAWLLFAHLQRGGEAGAVLLLIYWALNLPVLGQEIALLARQYPFQRNVTLRLLEPLGAPEERNGEGQRAKGEGPSEPAALASCGCRSPCEEAHSEIRNPKWSESPQVGCYGTTRQGRPRRLRGGERAGRRAHNSRVDQSADRSGEPCGDRGPVGGWEIKPGGASAGLAPRLDRPGARRGGATG